MTADTSSLGERIRRFRGNLMTQQELATAAGVSIDVIRKLEQGRRQSAAIGTLHKIARALDIDTAQLLAKSTALPSVDPSSGIVAIRRALTAVDDLIGEIGNDPLPLSEAQRTVEYAWGCYWSGRYDRLAEVLPTALAGVRATVESVPSDDREKANELLARLYWVAGCTLVHMGQSDSAYLAIRLALTASQKVDDKLLHATLRGSVAWQLLVQGRFEESRRVAMSAADGIEPHGDARPEHLSAYGSLLITAATAAGRDRRRDEALALLGAAREIADRNGCDRDDYETAFGPSQVVMQTVDVNVVTENYVEALDEARKMPQDTGLPLASRARHLADQAFAHVRIGHERNAFDSLLTLERMAPDWIRYQTLPRLVVGELVARQRRRNAPLMDLAKRLGVSLIT